jgi:hypothetical protein
LDSFGTFYTLFFFMHPSRCKQESNRRTHKKCCFFTRRCHLEKEITIFEDGTHFFTTPDDAIYILKSSLIDLSRYEDKRVRVIGEHPETISKSENTVITVFSVETLLQDSDMRESLFTESDYYFAASFPGSWQRVLSPDGLLQYAPEGADAVVSVRLVDENSEQGEDYETSIQEWSLVNVGESLGINRFKAVEM